MLQVRICAGGRRQRRPLPRSYRPLYEPETEIVPQPSVAKPLPSQSRSEPQPTPRREAPGPAPEEIPLGNREAVDL